MLGDISLATNIYIVTATQTAQVIDGLWCIILDQLKEEPNGNDSIFLWKAL